MMPPAWPARRLTRLHALICALAWAAPFFVVFGFVRPYVGQSYYVQVLGGLLLAGAGLAAMLGWRPALRPGSPAVVLVLLNCLGMALAVWRARDPAYALNAALLPLAAAVLWLVLISLPGRELLLRRMAVGFCCVAGVLAAYGVLQHFGFELLPYGDAVRKNRVIATIGHPNYLGSMLGPLLMVLCGLILAHPRRRAAWLAPAVAMLILFCMGLARTRAIWIGIFVGFVLFALLGIAYCRAHRTGLRRMRVLILGAFLQFAALVAAVTLVVPRFSELNMVERFTSSKEITSRFMYWDTAIGLGRQQPLLGQGYGMFNALFWETTEARFKAPDGNFYQNILPSIAGVMAGHAHNEYLEVFCEQGWSGLVLLLALLCFFLVFGARALLAEPDTARAFELLGCWAGLLASMVDAFFGFPWRLPISLLVLVMIGARLQVLLEQRPEDRQPAAPAGGGAA